jgi:AraC-like DNA-binding protein
MTTTATDYFRYFAPGPEARRWGVALTAAGFTAVPARAPYPPKQHPADHHFGWERGRVLESLQVVWIARGRGVFESEPTGRRAIERGAAFALVPKVWHRYRPDPDTGWVESWIEVQGPVVENLLKAKVFSTSDPVRQANPAAGLEAALDAVHLRAREAGPGFDAELAAAALAVLAAWEKTARLQPARSRMVAAIAQAEQRLAENIAAPINVEELARQLGVAYSHFRREFKTHTGFAPWQYVLHLRLARARRMLASGDATLDEIAERVGFSSAFHFSAAFKRSTGIAPNLWRQQFARTVARSAPRTS